MVDLDHYIRRRHWTREKCKEQNALMNKKPRPNRHWHSMKTFVDTVRQVLPEEIKNGKHTSNRG